MGPLLPHLVSMLIETACYARHSALSDAFSTKLQQHLVMSLLNSFKKLEPHEGQLKVLEQYQSRMLAPQSSASPRSWIRLSLIMHFKQPLAYHQGRMAFDCSKLTDPGTFRQCGQLYGDWLIFQPDAEPLQGLITQFLILQLRTLMVISTCKPPFNPQVMVHDSTFIPTVRGKP